MTKIIIDGIDGDPDTRIELEAQRVELEQTAETVQYHEGGRLSPYMAPGRNHDTILASRAFVTKVSGGFGPDSPLGMVARAGRSEVTAAQAKLERPKAFAVRMRLTTPDGASEMRTYTAASGTRYIGEHGFPDQIKIVLNPVEVEELREFSQFEIVEVAEDSGDVDGQLAVLREELERLVDNAEVIRQDPSRTIDVMDEVRTKGELYVRMLRSEADRVEAQVEAAHCALSDEAKGGKP